MGTAPGQREPDVEVRLDAPTRRAALASRLTSGLTSKAAHLPRHQLLAGDEGDLDRHLEAAEAYYPARSERELVATCARDAHDSIGARSVVVLGPTPRGVVDAILAAGVEAGGLDEVLLVDERAEAVRAACAGLATRHPSLRVRGVAADAFHDVGPLGAPGPRLFAISGVSLGRLDGRERAKLWHLLADELGRQDGALFGADLLKNRHLMSRAYDDPTGIQAALTHRALVQLTAEWAMSIDPDGWEHRASWDERTRSVVVSARARGPQRVLAPALGVDRSFAADEAIELERRTAFLGHGLDAELAFAGLGVRRRWTTGDDGYSLALAST